MTRLNTHKMSKSNLHLKLPVSRYQVLDQIVALEPLAIEKTLNTSSMKHILEMMIIKRQNLNWYFPRIGSSPPPLMSAFLNDETKLNIFDYRNTLTKTQKRMKALSAAQQITDLNVVRKLSLHRDQNAPKLSWLRSFCDRFNII